MNEINIKEKTIDGLTRDEVIKQYEPMVHKLVNSATTNCVCNTEDLIQEAFMAIIEAFDSYDESKAKFSSWVWTNIRNAIRRYQKDNLGALKGNYLYNKINMVSKIMEDGEYKDNDIIQALEDVGGVSAKTALSAPYLMNQYSYSDITEIGSMIADPAATFDSIDEINLDWQTGLNKKEILVISLLYGFGCEAKSLKEAAEIMHQSPRSVDHLCQKALNHIRSRKDIGMFAPTAWMD